MIETRLARPWLDVALPGAWRTLGFALNAPGFVDARHIHWREVRDGDLTQGFDVASWLAAETARTGRAGPCFLTSRDVGTYTERAVTVDGETARAVATVGLSNAERIGTRAHAPAIGTINLLLLAETPLSDGARVEALSLAAEARTAAVIEAGPDLPTGRATGTGTDCLVVAAPSGDRMHAGKHTALGEALGRAAYEAVRHGCEEWMATCSN